MVLLDTDIIIDIQRGSPAAENWFANADLMELAVPGYVILELIQEAHNAKEARAARKIIEDLPVVWPNEEACSWAVQQFERAHLSFGIGVVDMLIASTAIGHSATLCTFNLKHYRNVPGLITLQPYAR